MTQEKVYTVEGVDFKMREKPSYWQMKNITDILAQADITEKTPMLTIVSKISEHINDVMHTVFCDQPDDAAAVDWTQQDFDAVAEIVMDFLSSSTMLKSLVRI